LPGQTPQTPQGYSRNHSFAEQNRCRTPSYSQPQVSKIEFSEDPNDNSQASVTPLDQFFSRTCLTVQKILVEERYWDHPAYSESMAMEDDRMLLVRRTIKFKRHMRLEIQVLLNIYKNMIQDHPMVTDQITQVYIPKLVLEVMKFPANMFELLNQSKGDASSHEHHQGRYHSTGDEKNTHAKWPMINFNG
jgi:hypothetical protein